MLNEIVSLQNAKYRIVIKVIVPIKPGTIKELISIKPSVSRSRKNTAIKIIINEPSTLGIPKKLMN